VETIAGRFFCGTLPSIRTVGLRRWFLRTTVLLFRVAHLHPQQVAAQEDIIRVDFREPAALPHQPRAILAEHLRRLMKGQ